MWIMRKANDAKALSELLSELLEFMLYILKLDRNILFGRVA